MGQILTAELLSVSKMVPVSPEGKQHCPHSAEDRRTNSLFKSWCVCAYMSSSVYGGQTYRQVCSSINE